MGFETENREKRTFVGGDRGFGGGTPPLRGGYPCFWPPRPRFLCPPRAERVEVKDFHLGPARTGLSVYGSIPGAIATLKNVNNISSFLIIDIL